jgi:hypothetical protein
MNNIKVYTYFTISHKILMENYFKPSISKIKNITVINHFDQNQISPTGSYLADKWKEATYKKIDIFIKACLENYNKIFIFSDVDIYFIKDNLDFLTEELGDYDIALQNDAQIKYDALWYCTGFFIARGSDKLINLFNLMKDSDCIDDQYALNKYIYNIPDLKYKLLSEKVYTIGKQFTAWLNQDFDIPEYVSIFHANYTIGIENKIKLLEMVKDKTSNIII